MELDVPTITAIASGLAVVLKAVAVVVTAVRARRAPAEQPEGVSV